MLDSRADTGSITANQLLLTDRDSTSAQTTLADSCSMTIVGPTLGQCWKYVGNRLSFRSRYDVGPDNVSQLLLDDDSRASALPTLKYVGKRLLLRSRHDVGPDNVSQLLLDDDSRASVLPTLKYVGKRLSLLSRHNVSPDNFCLMTTLGPTLDQRWRYSLSGPTSHRNQLITVETKVGRSYLEYDQF